MREGPKAREERATKVGNNYYGEKRKTEGRNRYWSNFVPIEQIDLNYL